MASEISDDESMEEMTEPKVVNCPRCAADFECTGDFNCWCMALSPRTIHGAAEGKCFCPDCMTHAE